MLLNLSLRTCILFICILLKALPLLPSMEERLSPLHPDTEGSCKRGVCAPNHSKNLPPFSLVAPFLSVSCFLQTSLQLS